MRYVMLLLVAATGACDMGPNFDAKWSKLVVSPDTVHAGQTFNASATVAFENCAPNIELSYDNQGAFLPVSSTISVTLTAVFGDETVQFDAKCDYGATGTGEIDLPTEYRSITVLP